MVTEPAVIGPVRTVVPPESLRSVPVPLKVDSVVTPVP